RVVRLRSRPRGGDAGMAGRRLAAGRGAAHRDTHSRRGHDPGGCRPRGPSRFRDAEDHVVRRGRADGGRAAPRRPRGQRGHGGALLAGRGIVVGHIYQLGTRYSEPLKATFLDEDGTEQPYLMGCYGIGISRIMAAVAEQYHDDDGLTLPPQIAPYGAVVIATN